MAAATSVLLDRLDSLVALFNRGSLDLPDGALSRDATFRLNGVAYEETLGRSPQDPLVRLIARGPGGYRFLVKALRYALPDAALDVGALERAPLGEGCRLTGGGRVHGRLRGDAGAFDERFRSTLTFSEDGALTALEVEIGPDAVARLVAAREDGRAS